MLAGGTEAVVAVRALAAGHGVQRADDERVRGRPDQAAGGDAPRREQSGWSVIMIGRATESAAAEVLQVAMQELSLQARVGRQ